MISRRARRDRRSLGRNLRGQSGQTYTGPQHRAVSQRHQRRGAAAWRSRRWGRSIARRTSRSISTPASSVEVENHASAAARATPASLPQPTSSRTKSAITCRTCSASLRACTPAAAGRQQGEANPPPGPRRVAGRLFRRASGPIANRKKRPRFPRAGRHRCRAADRVRHRRRHACRRQAQGRVVPDSVHPRLCRTAQALVHDRLSAGHRCRPATRSATFDRRHDDDGMPDRRPSLRSAQDRGADGLRYALARRRQVRRDARPSGSTKAGHVLAAARRSSPTTSRRSAQVEARGSPIPASMWSITTGGTGFTGRDVTPEAHRAAVREADGRLRDRVSHGEPRQDRHLGDPEPRDRRRCRRDLYLLPAGFARRLPRRLGRHPRARSSITATGPAISSRSCRGWMSICDGRRRRARRSRARVPRSRRSNPARNCDAARWRPAQNLHPDRLSRAAPRLLWVHSVILR